MDKYIKLFEKSKQEDARNLPITEDIMNSPTYEKRKGGDHVYKKGI